MDQHLIILSKNVNNLHTHYIRVLLQTLCVYLKGPLY